MNPVLTEKQARAITGGRKPLVPIEYEEACKALQTCVTLDEGKYWSDKADALAAWAKIYRDDTVERQAKILKLRAYRRMGELATELRPHKSLGFRGTQGPSTVLREAGLSESQANSAVKLGKMPESRILELENLNIVPSPTHARQVNFDGCAKERMVRSRLSDLASAINDVSPGKFRSWAVVNGGNRGRESWRRNAEEIHEWIGILLSEKGA